MFNRIEKNLLQVANGLNNINQEAKERLVKTIKDHFEAMRTINRILIIGIVLWILLLRYSNDTNNVIPLFGVMFILGYYALIAKNRDIKKAIRHLSDDNDYYKNKPHLHKSTYEYDSEIRKLLGWDNSEWRR